MRIDINLATRPYEDSRQFWIYWGTGLALLSIATALLLFMTVTGLIRASGDRAQIAKLEQQIAAYDREKAQAVAVLNQPQNRELRDQSRFLNELFERKAFSWTRVFEDLEQVMPAHLRVISIHPNVSGDNNVTIRLMVGGESQIQALDLVRKMENSQHFKQTKIIRADAVTDNNGEGDRVRAEIEAAYTPLPQAPAGSGGVD
jgi:type IV pilus assembly protein PilN